MKQDAEPIAYNIQGAGSVLGGVGRSTIYRLIADGELDARKVCGRTVVSRASIVSYFARLERADIKSKK